MKIKKIYLIFLISLIVLSGSGCSSFLLSDSSAFIKTNGKHFELDGMPYYFTGANFWYGCYIGSSGSIGDRERLIRELDNLKAIGVTNLRVLGGSEKSYFGTEVSPAIQIEPGIYNEDLLQGLDFLLAEMGRRNMHAVIYLNNYWNWTGGMAQYNAWAGDGNGVRDNGDYGLIMDYAASFYANDKAKKLFNDYVLSIINRKNTVTSEYYYNDPAIMAWQLANEPRPGRDHKHADDYCRWINETAQLIHNADPNHLVSTGSEGLEGTLKDSSLYIASHKFNSIDYLTFHLWAKNWGWFDAKNSEATYPVTESNAVAYISKHIDYASRVNKPVVMEEFGLARDNENYFDSSKTFYRDKYFSKIFELVYESAVSASSIAGTNFWAWGGEARPQHIDAKYQQGDIFVGDPPQEPQGLNSVFNTDSSTISIIKNHSDKMRLLCK